MGASGVSAFDDDDSMDWLSEFASDPNEEAILAAFDAVTSTADYLESPECGSALAAAEVVAALRGRPSDQLEAYGYRAPILGANLEASDAMISKALAAIDRIRKDSEVKELWSESGGLEQWNAYVDDVRSRVTG